MPKAARLSQFGPDEIAGYPYIQDGLVVALDGEWNAGMGVHDPSIESWKSLIGACSIDIKDRDMYFTDNALRISQTPSESICILKGASFKDFAEITIEMLILPREGLNSSFSLFEFGDVGITLLYNAYYVSVWDSTKDRRPDVIPSCYSAIDMNVISSHSISSKFVGRNTYYRNATLMAGRDIRDIQDVTGENTLFTRTKWLNQRLSGDIFSVRIYNRQLSESEVKFNYEIDKRRFIYPAADYDYVTNGLVLALDGIWNDGLGRHDATATAIKNIADPSGSQASIYQSDSGKTEIYDTGIHFSGEDVGLQYDFKKNPVKKGPKTIEMFCESVGEGSRPSQYLYQFSNSASLMSYRRWITLDYGLPSHIRLPIVDKTRINIPLSLQYSFHDDESTYGAVHTENVEFTIPGPRPNALQEINSVGGIVGPSFNMPGKLNAFRIYDRALSPDELRHNYETDVRRFMYTYDMNGLILALDGIYNAGMGQHKPDATSWKNLVGDDSISLSGDYKILDDAINFNSTGSDGIATGHITLPAGARSIEVVITEQRFTKKGYQVDIGPYALFQIYAAKFGNEQLAANYAGWWSSYTTVIDGIKSYSRSDVIDPSYTHYFNGINTNLGEGGHPIDAFDGDIYIANNDKLNSPAEVRISAIRIYDRALTADEIQRNYETDKKRFKLPDQTI